MVLYARNSTTTNSKTNEMNITFTCAIHGQPHPKINWFFRGHPINDFRNILHFNQLNNASDKERVIASSLIFYNITKSNEGLVQCNGQNEVGEVSSIGFFKVFGKMFYLIFCFLF